MTATEMESMIRQMPIAEARRLFVWLDEYLDDGSNDQMKADASMNLAQMKLDTIETQRSWLELEGIGADSGSGEDAQVWVNRMRDEWDDRENQWRTSV